MRHPTPERNRCAGLLGCKCGSNFNATKKCRYSYCPSPDRDNYFTKSLQKELFKEG